MVSFVKIMKNVQRSGRQENTYRIAQQIHAGGYSHHFAPLEHLYEKNHYNYVSDFRLQFIERAYFHPLRPLLSNPIRHFSEMQVNDKES